MSTPRLAGLPAMCHVLPWRNTGPLRPVLHTVEDARDFNGVLRDLIDHNVRQREKTNSRRPAIRLLALPRLGNSPKRAQPSKIVLATRRASTNEPALGFQKPLKALAGLFMGEILVPLQGFLAALHGLDETGFFLEIVRENILHQLVRFAAPAWRRSASASLPVPR